MRPKNVHQGKTLDELRDVLDAGYANDDDNYVDAVMDTFERFHLEGFDLGEELASEPAIGVAARAWYAISRLLGSSPTLALMLATQRPPCAQDDTTFWRGRWNQFADNPYLGDYYDSVAKAHGLDTTGSVYMPGLARFPGDPKAWVKGKGDIKRVCEESGFSCQGEVNVQARNDIAPPPDVDVADDIVEQKMLSMMEANPDLEHTDQAELYHQAKDSLLPAA